MLVVRAVEAPRTFGFATGMFEEVVAIEGGAKVVIKREEDEEGMYIDMARLCDVSREGGREVVVEGRTEEGWPV